jgi:hypothetical protein
MPQGGLGQMPQQGVTPPGWAQQQMANVLGPLMQPNYGVQQIDPQYLTGAMPSPGGRAPPGVLQQRPALGSGAPGTSQIPQQPTGASTL